MHANGKRAAPTAQGRDVSDDEHPRERLLRSGPESLSNAELLSVLFRTGRPGSSALDSAHDLLRQIGGLIIVGTGIAPGGRLRALALGCCARTVTSGGIFRVSAITASVDETAGDLSKSRPGSPSSKPPGCRLRAQHHVDSGAALGLTEG